MASLAVEAASKASIGIGQQSPRRRRGKTGTRRAAGPRRHSQEIAVEDGYDLEQTTHRAIYANFRVGEIRASRGNEAVEIKVPG